MMRISDITALIADDAMAASYLSMGAYRSGLISIIQSEAPTPGVINSATAASGIKWPRACRERVRMAGLGEHGMIDLGHLWNRETGEVAAILIGPPDAPEAITLAFPCQSWAARVFNAMVEEQGPVDQPKPRAAQPVLAPKHEGLRVDASGVLGRVEGPEKHFANQMLAHLEEMSTRYYTGDVAVVDEFLQLYCLDSKRPEVLELPMPCSVREEEPAEYRVDRPAEQQEWQEPVPVAEHQTVHQVRLLSGPPSKRRWQDSSPQRIDYLNDKEALRASRGEPALWEFRTLYTTPPAAPDVSGLVEALNEAMRNVQAPSHFSQSMREYWKAGAREAIRSMNAALSAYREQQS